ncbi:MAG: hypothetical protein LRY55_04390 [Leadbetterella sp.]|nr:hypothetical protein [Leadbetterella sp.]
MKLLTLFLALLFFPMENIAAESAPVAEHSVVFKTKKKKKGGFFKRIFKKKCKCPKVS